MICWEGGWCRVGAEQHSPIHPGQGNHRRSVSPPQTGAIHVGWRREVRVNEASTGVARRRGAGPRIGPRRARAGPDGQLRRPDACLRVRVRQHHGLQGQRRHGANRDSNSFYFQRWRLFTNVESADKKAKAVWGLEVGDITWGTGGGASGGEYRGCPRSALPVVVNPTVTIPPPAGSPPGTPPTVGDGHAGESDWQSVRPDRARVQAAASGLTVSTSRPSTRTSGPTPGSGCPGRPSRSVSRASCS